MLGMERHKRVLFNHLEVFLFGRCLGSDKVPESGNNPLGMERCHFSKSRVDLLCQESITMLSNGDSLVTSTPHSKGTVHDISFQKFSQDSLQSILSIDYTPKSLQPLNPRQRIKCLKESGVELIKDKSWTDEGKWLARLRQERQQVGCKCTGTSLCDPVRCTCSREGIPCQSDGSKFPCKCGTSCKNEFGRREYSHFRTKYHYKHTFERQLTQDLTAISVNGDCQICNEVSEETLQQLFAAPAAQKRKRAGMNVFSKQEPKLQKEMISEVEVVKNVVENIVPNVQSTVMSVTSVVPVIEYVAPLSYGALFDTDISPLKKLGKENMSSTPLQKKLTVVPVKQRIPEPLLSRFNDSWTQSVDAEPHEHRISLTEVEYWTSFLNAESPVATFLSPQTGKLALLNDINLRGPCAPMEKLVDYSIDSVSSSFQNAAIPDALSTDDMALPSPVVRTVAGTFPKKSYTFRQSTTVAKNTYFVSPEKRRRGKKSSKINFGAQKRCVGARLPRKTMRPVLLSPEKLEANDTDFLTHDMADVSLVPLADIDAARNSLSPLGAYSAHNADCIPTDP